MYFQSMLLLGYLYAHASARLLPTKKQITLHVALLLLCMVQLPLGLPGGWEPPASGNVIPWLIGVLTFSLGMPFLVLSATAPLLQRWLASADPPVRNPYVLYAASNAGSFLGLLAFPLAFEPGLRLSQQSIVWSAIYGVAVLLIGASGFVLWKRIPAVGSAPSPAHDVGAPPAWRDRLKWIALAFVPSSLLLGITTFLSTDVAATPLLWVVPLSLYLLTFVVVFSRGAERIAGAAALLHALLVTILAFVYFWQTDLGFRRAYALHLGVFALTCLVLHGRLAASKPSPKYLTEFYLWMSFGGALGGAFTALIVPMIFNSTGDYLMMVAVACFLRPSFRVSRQQFLFERKNVAFAILPALMLYAVARRDLDSVSIVGVPIGFIVSVLAVLFIIALMPSSARFGVAIASVGVAGYLLVGNRATLFSDRSFFGIYRVARGVGPVHLLYHGTTIHGAQFLDSARRLTPVTYYHPDGPVGDVFRVLQSRPGPRIIGAVGLGTGSILCYSRPGETWTFFEIDPEVAKIARNTRYFSFLSDCAVKPRIVFGDARLTLAREPAGTYSVLVVDAFSSDAIPVHMLTREAVALYQRLLRDDGLLMLHISNRRLDLEPVVAELAADAGLEAIINNHHVSDSTQNRTYNYGSDWVVLARDTTHFGPLASDSLWSRLVPTRRRRPWTDDYSNILSVIRW